jgi:hypothetical protein
MNTRLKKFSVLLLIAAFAVIGIAAVLPHTHGVHAPHHACWIGQAKQLLVSPADAALPLGAPIGSVPLLSLLVYCLLLAGAVTTQQSRAPPHLLVLSE